MSPPARAAIDDFDPAELVKEHGRDIEGIRKSLGELVARYGDDDKFGKSFEAIAAKDKRIDGAIKTILCDLISKDETVRTALTTRVKHLDRAWWGVFGKRLALAAWSLVLAVAAVVLGHFAWK
jgi:hypothetical protein